MKNTRNIKIQSVIYFISFLLSSIIVILLDNSFDKQVLFYPSVIITNIAIFILSFFTAGKISDILIENAQKKELEEGLTTILTEFTKEISVAYSFDEIVESIQKLLEKKADCSVLMRDSKKNYVIYNSASPVISEKNIYENVIRNFQRFTEDGCYFFDEELGLLSDKKNARGFFVVFNEIKLYVFCNSTRVFSDDAFILLFNELKRFHKRYEALSNLTGIEELFLEWNMIADTQKSFLPQPLPTIDRLTMAAYFQPLINVSGDYYTVIPLTPTRSLVLLGDVSGKGFSAALIMGIVINMVKTIGATTSLPTLVTTIEKTIKSMHFQDKYTVLFVGIIDTLEMELTYINASMADICILTETPVGYNIKNLPSNCSILGLVELGEVTTETCPLFWNDVLFLATDGISEGANEYGIELGDTAIYESTIKEAASKTPQEFIDDVNALAKAHTGGRKFKDDITMLVIKVEK